MISIKVTERLSLVCMTDLHIILRTNICSESDVSKHLSDFSVYQKDSVADRIRMS